MIYEAFSVLGIRYCCKLLCGNAVSFYTGIRECQYLSHRVAALTAECNTATSVTKRENMNANTAAFYCAVPFAVDTCTVQGCLALSQTAAM